MKIELTYLQLLLIGMGVGLILGLIPLILGLVKGKKKLGLIGLVASIVAGTIQSLLSLVTVIVFIWLILRNSAETEPAEAGTVNENLVDETVKESENLPENQTSGD